MSRLLQSRKFWIMVVDIVISTATYFVSQYADPVSGKNILWLIAAWQPVIYAVINGIATEDAANVTAYAVSDAATVAAGLPSKTPPQSDVPVVKQETPPAV